MGEGEEAVTAEVEEAVEEVKEGEGGRERT